MAWKLNPFTGTLDYYEPAAAVAAHAATHVTGGGDTVANAIAAGNSGLMSGADKTKLDGAAAAGANADITSMTALTQITRATGGAFDIAIGSAAGDDFIVDTNKLVVEGDTGNVGIGTTTPGGKLCINGGVTVGSDTDAGDNNLRVEGAITVIGTVDGRDIAADGSKLDGVEASADVTDSTNVNAAVIRIVAVKCIADDTALAVADGKAYFTVPIEFNGMNLVSVGAHVYTPSSSGLPTFQIHNLTDAQDMLSTLLTIDANEKDSKDAATPAVINTSYDDVATGDELRFDCDVAGTGAAGMEIRMGFQF